jgi:general L-amino acid transport system permease protein
MASQSRANLFSSAVPPAMTLALIYGVARLAINFFEWGFLNAVWTVPDNQMHACRSRTYTCCAVSPEMCRFILFGSYRPSYPVIWIAP